MLKHVVLLYVILPLYVLALQASAADCFDIFFDIFFGVGNGR